MSFRGTVAAFTLFFTFAGVNVSQDRVSSTPGCALLDATHPPYFVTYEGKSESEIHLRLRNNTTCAIVVETDDRYPTQLKKLPNGGGKIEAVLGSQDGLKLPLHYLLQRRGQGGSVEPAYGWGDSVFTYEIPAGQSITFNVPAARLKRRSYIAVPFRYPWEGDQTIATGVGGVVHRVYFLVEQLPPVALR